MSDQATVDANAAASAEDVTMVIDTVNNVAKEWAEFAVEQLQMNADDPCFREVVLLDRRDSLLGLRDMAQSLASGAADDLAAAINRSLSGYMDDEVSGVWLHTGFHDWLLDRNVFGVAPDGVGMVLGGPVGAAAAREIVRDKLPLPGSFRGGAPRGNPARGGVEVAPGVFLYAEGKPDWDVAGHAAFGRLQGLNIRREWWAYRNHIMQTVAGIARPIARWELRQLVVGPSSADLPAYVWAQGDPIAWDSKLGTIYEQEAQLNRLITIADAECKAFRARQTEIENVLLEQDALERERAATRTAGWQRVAAIGLGAFALAAVARGR